MASRWVGCAALLFLWSLSSHFWHRSPVILEHAGAPYLGTMNFRAEAGQLHLYNISVSCFYKFRFSSNMFVIFALLAMAGDIQVNPGPELTTVPMTQLTCIEGNNTPCNHMFQNNVVQGRHCPYPPPITPIAVRVSDIANSFMVQAIPPGTLYTHRNNYPRTNDSHVDQVTHPFRAPTLSPAFPAQWPSSFPGWPARQARMRNKRTNLTRVVSGSAKLTLACAVQNVRSINNKTTTIHTLITDRNLDILALTETWIKPSDPGYDFSWNELMPSGYRCFNQDRSSGRGGGVAVVLSQRVKSTEPLAISVTLKSIEFIALRIFPCSTEGFILVVVYRPPGNSIPAFLSDLDILLVHLKSICDNLVLCGDINLHLEQSTDSSVQAFNSLLGDFSLSNVTPLVPTHNRGHTLDCIALRDSHVHVSVEDLGLSDHCCLLFHLALDLHPNSNKPKAVTRRIRKFKSIPIEAFNSDLAASLDRITDSGDLDAYTNNIYGAIKTTLDKHAPLKPAKCRSKSDVIWNDELKLAKVLCRKAERRYVKSKLTVDRQILHHHRHIYDRLIRKSKSDYYVERIASSENSQRELFKVVSDLLDSTSPRLTPVPTASTSLSDTFAQFFTGKISKIIAGFPVVDSQSSDVFSLSKSSSGFPDFELSEFHNVSTEQVQKARAVKTSALDLLPKDLFLSVYPVLLPHLTHVNNNSLTSGTVPSCFKRARITPLLKKPTADSTELASYRPVSNLSFFSKVLESVVARQLNVYLSDHLLLNPVQSAYRHHHSTETALLHVYSELLVELDQGRSAFLVLLDLSAAFDTINHKMLLKTLNQRFHISDQALKWIASYLDSRTFTVGMPGESSEVLDLGVGVPQGSVLGPVLFSLFTAPLHDIFSARGIKAHFYADDTQFWVSFDQRDPANEASARELISSVFCEVRDWMLEHQLMINPSKTVFLPVSRKLNFNDIQPLCLDGTIIPPSKSARNLGIIFDHRLSFEKQVSDLRRICFFHLRRLNHIRPYVPSDQFESLVHSFITSRVDCCNSLYFNLPKYLVSKIQNIHNSAARCILHRRKVDSARQSLYDLHWLPVHARIRFKLAILAFKILQGDAPKYFCESIHAKVAVRSTRASTLPQLVCPSFSRPRLKSCGDRSFYSSCVAVWNSLLPELRSLPTLASFKKGLKTSLFSASYHL